MAIKSKMVLQTGQKCCYDSEGKEIPCAGTGQDAEFIRGISRPGVRFEQAGDTVIDLLTGLVWTINGNIAEFPMTWQEAFDFIAAMNGENSFGFSDWRLPNRRELRSLMDYQAAKPSLPRDHPFNNVFMGWYWTSTTAAIDSAYAWYIHMEGARMFYGRKNQYYLVWPVRGEGDSLLPRTGQSRCFDAEGCVIPCKGSGQDGERQAGCPWPVPRFKDDGESVVDMLSGLRWLTNADLSGKPLNWSEAFDTVRELNENQDSGRSCWRLPNINELESLVDCANCNPALPAGHFFGNVREVYWSSTTSFFETDWAWALYLHKGALGVGHKKKANFFVWPVCDAAF